MNARARRAIAGALIVAAWAVPGVTTHASADTTMSCTAEADFTMTPGLSTSPSSGTFATVNPGPLDCKGTKGTMAFSGKYGTKDPDSCSSGGEGTSTSTYKFADGTVSDDAVEFTYGPFQGGALGGSFKGAHSSGTFEVTSIEGDCVSKPITKAHATFKNLVIKR
jgi:hypothetical protein